MAIISSQPLYSSASLETPFPPSLSSYSCSPSTLLSSSSKLSYRMYSTHRNGRMMVVNCSPSDPISFRESHMSRNHMSRNLTPFDFSTNETTKSSQSYKWQRVLLKVSGEALAGDQTQSINPKITMSIAREVAMTVLARPGVNILLPRLGFPYCEICASFNNIEVRHYDLLPEKGWEVDPDAVEALANENIVAMSIINPGNPCENVYTYEHLKKVVETARKLGLVIIADEVYDHLTVGRIQESEGTFRARFSHGLLQKLQTPLRSLRPSEKLSKELIQEILCRLPLDSVFESKCVSPQWRDLISSPHFVMMHNNQSIRNQSFSFLSVKTSFRYISDFNRCKQVIEFDLLRLRSHVSSLKIVGSVNGLVCLENYSADIIEKDRSIFICNQVIGDWIKLPHLPALTNGSCNFFGFGYCGGSCKYKVVRIGIDENTGNYSVDIITVGDESWRSIESSTLIDSKVVKTLMKSHREIECYGVFVDGYLHWVIPYKNQMDDGIRAFDIDIECFVMVPFPGFVQDNQVRSLLYTGLLSVGVLGGKLMLIDNSKTGEHQVWIMGKYGVKNYWFLQYVIPVKPGYRRLLQPLGVQANGKLLAFFESGDAFYSYDSETRKVVKLEVVGPRMFHGLILYMPSLVSVKNAIAPSNPSNHQ